VFFGDEDRVYYLHLLKKYGKIEGIKYWAYCLMDNHIHLAALPKYAESLSKGLGIAHWKYSLKINLREEWKGYLWQGRFFSCPLENAYLYRAIRYIELNPVRAGIVKKAEDYPWSSARAHIQNAQDLLVAENPLTEGVKDWASFLAEGTPESEARLFRLHSASGRPLGNEAFVCALEKLTGRVLRPKKGGRKPFKSIGC
jgi:putative transposase